MINTVWWLINKVAGKNKTIKIYERSFRDLGETKMKFIKSKSARDVKVIGSTWNYMGVVVLVLASKISIKKTFMHIGSCKILKYKWTPFEKIRKSRKYHSDILKITKYKTYHNNGSAQFFKFKIRKKLLLEWGIVERDFS